mgnify:CR=1 FL=1
MPEEMNAYEAERAARIEANRERMRALGLAEGGALRVGGLGESEAEYLDAPGAGLALGARPKPRKVGKASSAGKRAREPAAPARASRRLRGIDVSGEPTATPARVVSYAERASDADRRDRRRGLAFPDPASFPGSEIAAPFTLRSIGVTVHALGDVHRGAFAGRYWSSPGCLFHHAYPVGYVATKHHFGQPWRMTIEAGEVGPVFRVTNERTNRTFAGPSPTKPWTAVCESIKTRTRISGPLFFGFSDPVTVRALAAKYTKREIAACVSGDAPPERAAGSELESLVFELRARVDGLGEHAAIALARTTTLVRPDGREHAGARAASLAELAASAAADGGARLRAFLETDEMVSEWARRWPAWRARVVPRIVASLLAIAGEEKDASGDLLPDAIGEAPGRSEKRPREARATGASEPGDGPVFAKKSLAPDARDATSDPKPTRLGGRGTEGAENVPPSGSSGFGF